MAEHNVLTDPFLHEPKGVSTAAVGQVYLADGAGSGDWGEVIAAPSTKTVLVNTAADLPTPAAGKIQLLGDTEYLLTNDITLSDTLVSGEKTLVKAASSNLITLTYTGTGNALEVGAVRFNIRCIKVTALSGTVFDVVGATEFAVRQCRFIGGAIGNVADTSAFFIRGAEFTGTSGLTFSGTTNTLASIKDIVSNISSGVVFDLGSVVFNTFIISSLSDVSPGATTLLSGLTGSGNIIAGSIGYMASVFHFGASVPLAGIAPEDDRWIFTLNNKVIDTVREATISVQGNALETAISASNTPVKANAVWTEEKVSGYTSDSTGTVTQSLSKGLIAPITISVSALAASGTNVQYTFYIAINGAPVTATAIPIALSSANLSSATLIWQQQLDPSDTIELWAENNDSAVNVIVDHAIIRIT